MTPIAVLTRADLESIHKYSSRHRDLLERSDRAGCFHCLAIYNPSEIVDWIDEPAGATRAMSEAVTALCARCGIDSVLPSAAPIALTPQALAEMHQHWFKE